MKTILLAVTLLLFTSATFADPKRVDADKWLSDFRLVRDKTSDAIFIHHFDKRRDHTKEIANIMTRAEKLFDKNKFADCISAANWVNDYWSSEVWLLSSPADNTHVNLSGVVNGAWQAGQYYASCKKLVEDIK